VGVEVIYFGYGFFVENVVFVCVCEKVGIVFIGLFVSVIDVMGLKIKVREIMSDVGVLIVLGIIELVELVEDVRVVIDELVGYFVVIKVVGGGGGKGFWVVELEDEFEKVFEGVV